MTIQFSVTVRNARADAIEPAIGGAPVMKIRSGAKPSATSDADSGDVLATLALPVWWLAAASSGSVAMSGTWSDPSADATGTAGHFRIYASDGSTVHMQGAVSLAGDGGDLIVDNTSFRAGQPFSITAFGLTEGNA